ncbi:unnamed protein product [Litomosoides sigmodontis]|uniref:Apple domain-containing protein n=1 Tax=Litomosoides sigmodontis TaxID=42156 RepID=A0A3P6SQ54_LITSI|nr:unnamed protein product [Litomosoides sigmodontis]
MKGVESFVPPPAHVFSGHSDFDWSKRNHKSTFVTEDMNQQTLNLTSHNFTPLSPFQDSSSLLYRSQEEVSNNLYKIPKITDITEEFSTQNEMLFHHFRGDNFDENYQRINETYFSEGISAEEEKRPYNPYAYAQFKSSSTTASRRSLQSVPSSSSTLPHTSTAITLDFQVPTSTTPSDRAEISNPTATSSTDSSKWKQIYEKTKKNSKLATTPLTMQRWEMQRTDSGRSIIKITTAPTSSPIDRTDVIISANENTVGNFNGDKQEFIIFKENSPSPSSANASNISTILVHSANRLATTTVPTATSGWSLPAALISKEDDGRGRSSTRKIANFSATKITSTTLQTASAKKGAKDWSPSPTTKSSSSISHPPLSPPQLPAPTSSFSLSSARAVLAATATDENRNRRKLLQTSATDKLLRNEIEIERKMQSKLGNNVKSETTNGEKFNWNDINLGFAPPQNPQFTKWNRKKAEKYRTHSSSWKKIQNNLIHSFQEERQAPKEQTLTGRILVTPLLSSKNRSFHPFELSTILGNQIDDAFGNLIHLEKQQTGISIPKYENSLTDITFTQVPKRNGINTVESGKVDETINTSISIKREITKGKILEEQKSVINGKSVILELWDPVIYGHNWLANPGAVIHDTVQLPQAQIYNVGSRIAGAKNHNQNAGTFGARSSNGDDQEGNILIIYAGNVNSSAENKLQGIGKQRHSRQCFYVMDNCALSATVPFERRIGISLIECAQFCSSLLGCLSASYSSRFSICDTYHFKFGLRGKTIMKMIGQYYLEPQMDDTFKCSIDCLTDKNAMMLETPGWRISVFNGNKRKYFTTKMDCLQSCHRNLYKKNTVYYCSAAVFEENSNRCSLYSTNYPVNDTLIRDSSSTYYEKHCFSGQIAKLCNGGVIKREPQHVLTTSPDAILTTSTLAKCLLKCLWSLRDGRTFQCHSLMYFYKREVDNCILSSRSRRNSTNSLKEETVAVVDYFDLDKCLNIPPLMAAQTSKATPIRTKNIKIFHIPSVYVKE